MYRHTPPAFIQAALLGLAATGLTACGGGSGDAAPTPPAASAPAPSPAPAPAPQSTISGTVADGPLAGATVCYDLNDNAQCDADEPTSAPTDADGRYSLTIDEAQAGRHRSIAVVPASAIDRDTGTAVGAAFTLTAPATGTAGSQTVFVSPLTTLVQAQMEVSGQTTAQAATFVQSQAALTASPLADFTAGSDAAQREAAAVARLALLSANRQTTALADVVGQTDLSGGTVSAAQLRQVVLRDVLGALPTIAAAAADPAVRDAATPAARDAALQQAAGRVVSTLPNADPAAARWAVGVAKLPVDRTDDPVGPTLSLAALRYEDADNWFYRALMATAADNQPDASGRRRYYDLRQQRVGGQDSVWGYSGSPARSADLHWDGSAWSTCVLGTRSLQQPLDASGTGAYSYCGNGESGVRSRTSVDVGGKTLRNVIEMVRAVPGGNVGVNFSDWGPADLGLLGTATMPAGSTLSYQTNAVLDTSKAVYDPRTSNEVTVYSAAVAAGGDARNGASPACSIAAQQVARPVATLDELIARNTGTPCVFQSNAQTGPRDEWWSNSTASIGTLPGAVTPPAGTGNLYSTNAKLRVAFIPGTTTANFYRCTERAANGSNRNCDLAGTGSYRIETLGDGRAMELTGLPEEFLRLDYRRVFVERGGKVYFGFRTTAGRISTGVRLNMTAANTLFSQLGLPLLNPVD